MKHILAAGAMALACATASPLAALDLAQMSDSERATFRAEVRAYLLENPEVIMEAVAVLEARQANAQTQTDRDMISVNSAALFQDENSWAGGNLQGDITLVEFVDYRCGYCRKAHDEVAQLVQSDGNIRLILKEFPILDDQSVISSRFAIATRMVAGDAAYKAVHDALIAFKGTVAPESLARLAADLGLDAAPILAKMDSDEVTAVIRDNHQLAGRLQINGTPTFVLGEQMLRGYVPFDGMQKLVAEIRAQ